jgi:hypothetical protein
LSESKRVTLDNTESVFAVIQKFKDKPETKFKGVRVQIGEGENTVTIRFGEKEISAAVIEGTVSTLRTLLNEEQALVSVTVSSGATFETGFDAKEFSKISGIELKSGDIIQHD